MLNWIIDFSLRNRFVILALAVLLSVWGTYRAATLPIDVLPDLNRPRVTVMTESPGLAPEEVESLVTLPLENALSGVTGAVALRSSSVVGLSTVIVEFDWNADSNASRQAVFERLQSVDGALPEGFIPRLAPVASVMGQIMAVAVRDSSGKTSPRELRTLADWTIRRRLLALSGVSEVYTTGGERKIYQVRVRPDDLIRCGVRIENIESAIARGNGNVSGGYLTERGPEQYLVRSVGRIESADDLAKLVVRADCVPPIRLSEVAEVAEGDAVRVGDASIRLKNDDGSVTSSPAVVLTVGKQPSVDSRRLTDAVNAELRAVETELRRDYPGLSLDAVYQQRTFIDRAIRNVLEALRDGAGLVLLVVLLFLMSLRTTFITFVTIPLSLAVTAIVFTRLGLSVNAMTLGGLAVAVGELVDDAIVDVENIFRRLRENALLPRPRAALEVVRDASVEIRSSIVNGTAITVIVFIPLFFLAGMEGRLFAPLGVAYVVALLTSLAVSLTVTPVLAYYLLPSGFRVERKARRAPLARLTEALAAAAIRLSLFAPKTVLTLAALFVAAGAVLFARLPRDFLPPFNEGAIQVNLDLMPGNSLRTSAQVAERMADDLISVDGVASVLRKTGRSELDEHAVPVSTTEFICAVEPEKSRDFPNILQEVGRRIGPDRYPGTLTFLDQPLQHLINSLRSGSSSKITLKVRGDDLSLLRSRCSAIQAKLDAIDSLEETRTLPIQADLPQVRVDLDRDALARFGLLPDDVNRTVELAMNGATATTVLEGQRLFDVVLRFDEDYREDLDRLRRLPIPLTPVINDDGETVSGLVPLSDVAWIQDRVYGPGQIDHENGRRQVMIQTGPKTGGAVEAKEKIEQALESEKARLAADGIETQISGLFESERSATRLLAALSALTLAGVFIILRRAFDSTNLALQIMAILPPALVGAVLALWFCGQGRTVPALVGMISLCGIASRNGILLMNHYFHLVEFEGESLDKKMIVRAGRDRVAPVLMTALTSMLGLAPLAVSPHLPGKELLYPVAVVVIGGLVTSTVMEFFVRPALFWTFGRKTAERLLNERRRPRP